MYSFLYMAKPKYNTKNEVVKLKKEMKTMKRKFRNPEVKNINYTVSGGISTSGSYWQLLTGIDGGTDKNQRVGTNIDLEKFEIRWMGALGDSGYNNLRCLIVKTHEPLVSVADLFDPVSFAAFTGVYASLNKDVLLKKIYDKNIVLNQTVAGQRVCKFQKRTLKCKEKIQYQTDSGLSVLENFYLVFVSDSGLIPNPSVNLVIKTFYTDV